MSLQKNNKKHRKTVRKGGTKKATRNIDNKIVIVSPSLLVIKYKLL